MAACLTHTKCLTSLQLQMPAGKDYFAEGFETVNVPTMPELVKLALEMDVKIIARQMTIDLLNLKKEDFMDGIDVGGAVIFLDFAQDANVTLMF